MFVKSLNRVTIFVNYRRVFGLNNIKVFFVPVYNICFIVCYIEKEFYSFLYYFLFYSFRLYKISIFYYFL